MKSHAYADPFPQPELVIGLIGSHCTGKTSAGTLLSQWTGFPLLAEGVRDVVHSMGYMRIPEVPDQVLMQWNIMRHQIYQETACRRMQEAQGAPSVAMITDRSTLDNAAYFALYQEGKLREAEYQAYLSTALLHAQKAYTHLIYFPILWDEIEDDGFRDTAPEPRRHVDAIIQDLLYEHKLWDKVYTVGPGSTSGRCAAILEHLQLWPRLRELAHNLKPKE